MVDDAVDAPVSNKIVRRAAKPGTTPVGPAERDELFGDSDDDVDDFEDDDEDEDR
jgi:hypothetical protein